LATVIPVEKQEEPANFDDDVRQPGLRWLREQKIVFNKKLPPGTELVPYWRKCLDDLHTSYAGVCAYLCVFVERVTGGVSVDHYVPKSLRARLAYEWSNYRLACFTMNARKLDFSSVLDPFTLKAETFLLELVTGRIYVNPRLTGTARKRAEDTIERLRLDSAECREIRARHYQNYCEFGYPEDYLKKYSPFVWIEAKRQGLL